MAQMSVAQFAGELKVPPSVLLEQLKAAGVNKRVAEDVLSEQDLHQTSSSTTSISSTTSSAASASAGASPSAVVSSRSSRRARQASPSPP